MSHVQKASSGLGLKRRRGRRIIPFPTKSQSRKYDSSQKARRGERQILLSEVRGIHCLNPFLMEMRAELLEELAQPFIQEGDE